jgi:ATP diphosphatase
MSEGPAAISRLLQVMRRLRDPQDGCPWDLAQDFASIAPYTIEEAYEVADAIDSGDAGRIREELGDLLFQVVFHARLAEERGWFDFDAVAAGIAGKLERRHPHVFGSAVTPDIAAQSAAWEQLKAEERALRPDSSAMADVPRPLPALTRARKLGKRAAQLQFDFADASGAREKLEEELAELDAELGHPCAERASARAGEEFGDVLFALVNWGRHLGLDAEGCLRGANERFERRFRRMEALAAAERRELGALDAAQWDELWERAKRAEYGAPRG